MNSRYIGGLLFGVFNPYVVPAHVRALSCKLWQQVIPSPTPPIVPNSLHLSCTTPTTFTTTHSTNPANSQHLSGTSPTTYLHNSQHISCTTSNTYTSQLTPSILHSSHHLFFKTPAQLRPPTTSLEQLISNMQAYSDVNLAQSTYDIGLYSTQLLNLIIVSNLR